MRSRRFRTKTKSAKIDGAVTSSSVASLWAGGTALAGASAPFLWYGLVGLGALGVFLWIFAVSMGGPWLVTRLVARGASFFPPPPPTRPVLVNATIDSAQTAARASRSENSSSNKPDISNRDFSLPTVNAELERPLRSAPRALRSSSTGVHRGSDEDKITGEARRIQEMNSVVKSAAKTLNNINLTVLPRPISHSELDERPKFGQQNAHQLFSAGE